MRAAYDIRTDSPNFYPIPEYSFFDTGCVWLAVVLFAKQAIVGHVTTLAPSLSLEPKRGI